MLKDREEFIRQFREADKSGIPDFTECIRPLDMALWVLCIAKDKVSERRLTGEEITFVIIEVQEISVNISGGPHS